MKNEKTFNWRVWIGVMAIVLPLVLTQTSIAGPGGNRFLRHFDNDGDGRVSKQEFTDLETRFDRMDKNSDGYIDNDELPRPRFKKGKRCGAFVDRVDSDSDGKISQEEFPGPKDRFAELDKDGDGYVTEEEAAQGFKNRGHRGRGMAPRCDTDGDGKISQEEFPGPPEAFSDLDEDGDGYLSREEMPRPRHHMRGNAD